MQDPAPKVIAIGDSTLIGGGVHNDNATFVQMVQAELKHERIYNLAVPGGDNRTGLMILQGLAKDRVPSVNRVVIEVLPGKLIAKAGDPTPLSNYDEEARDLAAFVPEAATGSAGPHPLGQNLHQRVQSRLEYWLGTKSALYARRDDMRIRHLGNYPIFAAINTATPKRLKQRFLGASFRGTNRLGAQVEDSPYEAPTTSEDDRFVYSESPEGQWLRGELEVAKKISRMPPIVIMNPVHYTYNNPTPADQESYVEALATEDASIKQMCDAQGATFLNVDSKSFQDPSLWFHTVAHFNEAGHRKLFDEIGPALIRDLNDDPATHSGSK